MILGKTSSTGLSDVQRTLQVKSPAMQGSDVIEVQRKLIALGYSLPQYGADGIYGRETESAVKKFQKANNLPVTGRVGPDTSKLLTDGGRGAGQLSQRGSSTVTAFFKNFDVAISEAKNEFWDPLPASQKWMFGIGGSALALGTGIAIYNGVRD